MVSCKLDIDILGVLLLGVLSGSCFPKAGGGKRLWEVGEVDWVDWEATVVGVQPWQQVGPVRPVGPGAGQMN